MKRNPAELSVAPGTEPQRFSRQEAQQWRQRWCEVYVGNRPVRGVSRYLWHQFSWGAYPCVSGSAAERSYAQQLATEVMVLASDRGAAALLAGTPPTWCSRMDYCVFPANLAWTMAFTHEDGWLGPYFARHPDYEALTRQAARQQLAAARKAQQLEWAKKWDIHEFDSCLSPMHKLRRPI